MKLKNKILKHHNEARIQDIEANLEILRKRNLGSKVHSLCCGWWPLRSIESHILYLENEVAMSRAKVVEYGGE